MMSTYLTQLFTQTKFLDRRFVSLEVRTLKVTEKALTSPYHLLESTARHMVVRVGLKVFCHLFDTSRQDRYLRLRAADIVLANLSQSNRFRFVILCYHGSLL